MNHAKKVRLPVISHFNCLLQTHFKKTSDLKEIFFYGLAFPLSSLLLEMHATLDFSLYSVKMELAGIVASNYRLPLSQGQALVSSAVKQLLPAEFQEPPCSLLFLVPEAINHQGGNVDFIRDNSSVIATFLFQSRKYNVLGHICVKKFQAKLITGFEMNFQEIHSCHRGRDRANILI